MTIPQVSELIDIVKTSPVLGSTEASQIVSILETFRSVRLQKLLVELSEGLSKEGYLALPKELFNKSVKELKGLTTEFDEESLIRKQLDQLLLIKEAKWPGRFTEYETAVGGTFSAMLSALIVRKVLNHSENDTTTKAFISALGISDASIPHLVAEAVQKGVLVAKYCPVQAR
jgi:hypothetical protein